MKPTSIIFLIVAAALLLSGTTMCIVASRQADNEGVALFETLNEQGDKVDIRAFDESTVTNVAIRVVHADVQIVGGSESTYVELINFPDNSYQFTQSGNRVTVGDSISATDFSFLMNILSDGFEFGGLRQYFRFDREDERPKTVRLHVSDSDILKKIDISVSQGNVSVMDMKLNADYTVEIGSGNFTLDRTPAFSSMNLKITKEGHLNMRTDLANGTFEAVLSHGNANLVVAQLNSRQTELVCPNGMIYFNEVEKGSSMKIEPLIATSSARIVCNNGNIVFYTDGAYSPVDPDQGADSSTTEPESQEPAA